MGHEQLDPKRPTITGAPLHPLMVGDPVIANGTRGDPILITDEQAFGGDFYILVAAKCQDPETLPHDHDHAGHGVASATGLQCPSGKAVAEAFQEKSQLWAQLVFPETTSLVPKRFRLIIHPERSHHVMSHELSDARNFQFEPKNLVGLFGDGVAYYLMAVELPAPREVVFSEGLRRAAGGESINTFKFDLEQRDATGKKIKFSHRGGLAITDRQDAQGRPQPLYHVWRADDQLDTDYDVFQLRLATRSDELFLRYNNANANYWEAFVPWAQEMTRTGQLDGVFFLGDSTNRAGTTIDVPRDVSESQFYHLAESLDAIPAPTFTVEGNHEYIAHAFPQLLTATNTNLTAGEVWDLSQDRYPKGDLAGFGNFAHDMFASLRQNDDVMIPYYDLIARSSNRYYDFGNAEPAAPDARGFRMTLLNTGPAHYADFDPTSRWYDEVLQYWPWGPRFYRIRTTWETISRGSPDTYGFDPEDIAWYSRQGCSPHAYSVTAAHAGLYRHRNRDQGYHPDRPLEPLRSAGDSSADLGYDTIVNGLSGIRSAVNQCRNNVAYVSGHSHSSDQKVVVVDSLNRSRVYEGPVLEALEKIPSDFAHGTQHFWFPQDGCVKSCAPSVHQLYGSHIDDAHKVTVFQTLDAAGVGGGENPDSPAPMWVLVTVNTKGLPAQIKPYYVIKELVPAHGNPNLVTTRLTVSETFQPNDRLLAEWAEYKRRTPEAVLDKKGPAGRAALRLRRAVRSDVLINEGSRAPLPHYIQYYDNPHISPYKVRRHIQVSLRSNGPLVTEDGTHWERGFYQVGIEYAFSDEQVFPLSRDFFVRGLELGYVHEDQADRAYLALSTPNLIDAMLLRERLYLRAGRFTLGPGFEYDEASGTARAYLHNQTFLVGLDVNVHPDLQLGLGLWRHNLLGDIFPDSPALTGGRHFIGSLHLDGQF